MWASVGSEGSEHYHKEHGLLRAFSEEAAHVVVIPVGMKRQNPYVEEAEMKALKTWGVVLAGLMLASPAMAAFTGGVFWYKDANNNEVQLYAPTKVRLLTTPGGASGGPFMVQNRGGGPVGQLPHHPGPINTNLFGTWCIESQINFTPNSDYWASVDRKSYSGGGPVGTFGDAPSVVSEWIYDQWKAGTLAASMAVYSYAAPTNAQISQAIWWAEQEASGSNNNVVKAALQALGLPLATPAANLADANHTYALNLWTGFTWDADQQRWYAQDVQSHLITVPVPGAMLLGLMGLGASAILKRRIA